MKTFAEKLKAERTRLGLTRDEADTILETCRGQVNAWERGRNVPHVLTQEAALRRLKAQTPKKKP